MKKKALKNNAPKKDNKPKYKNWHVVVNGGPDGQVELFGVNIFKEQWNNTGDSVELEVRPGEFKTLSIYTTKIDKYEYYFAATEVSMCVWVFALPG